MSRRLAVLPVLLLTLSVAPAAPRSKEKERFPTYCPTTVGARWIYDDGGRETTWEVTAVQVKEEETLVSVSEIHDGQADPLQKMSISPRGLFQSEIVHLKVDPLCMLKFPVKEGDSWAFQIAPQRGLISQSGAVTVGKTEEVETPAGKFQALRVEMVVTVRNGTRLDPPHKYSKWYHPEMGLVKLTNDQGFNRVLKSFTPGKK